MPPPAFTAPAACSAPPCGQPRPRATVRRAPPAALAPPRPLRALLPEPAASGVLAARTGAAVDLVDALLAGGGGERGAVVTDVLCVGWLRHFGCTLCLRQAKEWEAALQPRLGRRGRLALVGCGTAEQARTFREDAEWTGELYTDPGRGSYAALGFARGAGSVFNCW
jgi:hypothetical protein